MLEPQLKSINIPLTDLEGELATISYGDERHQCVMFTCPHPTCNHSHVVPYSSEGGKTRHTRVWKRISGKTIEDITLAPSYLAKCGRCIVHCMIQKGVVRLLSGSQAPATVW